MRGVGRLIGCPPEARCGKEEIRHQNEKYGKRDDLPWKKFLGWKDIHFPEDFCKWNVVDFFVSSGNTKRGFLEWVLHAFMYCCLECCRMLHHCDNLNLIIMKHSLHIKYNLLELEI